MNQIDLHTHSTASDGTFSPSELINEAFNAGLKAISLTDHDTIDGITEAKSCAKDIGIEFIPGIEFSTFFNHKEIHIVGLYIDYTDKELKKELEIQKKSRNEKNIKIVKKFNDIGINISYEAMEKEYAGSVITRAHFADYLLKKGYISSRAEAFDRYIGDGKQCYVDREKMEPQKAIEMIHAAGGVAILAHPVLYHLGNTQMHKLLDYLKSNGIDGIEAVYSTYTMGDELYIRRLAEEYDLLLSGGSDFHGANKPDIHLGKGRGHMFVPYEFLEKIKNYRIK